MNVIIGKLSREFFYYDRNRAYQTVEEETSPEEKKNQ